MPLMVNAALPVLVSVTVCAALVVCTFCAANVRFVGDSETVGVDVCWFGELPHAACPITTAIASTATVPMPATAGSHTRSCRRPSDSAARADAGRATNVAIETSASVTASSASTSGREAGAHGRLAVAGGAPIDARAVVEMVTVACAGPAPGVTVAGLNEHAAPRGRFAQPRVTAAGKAPPCGVTVTW